MSLSGLKNDNCRFQRLHEVQGLQGCRGRLARNRYGQADLELAGHRLAGEMDQVGFIAQAEMVQ